MIEKQGIETLSYSKHFTYKGHNFRFLCIWEFLDEYNMNFQVEVDGDWVDLDDIYDVDECYLDVCEYEMMYDANNKELEYYLDKVLINLEQRNK